MLRGLFVLLFIPIACFGQFTYSIDQSIPVEINDAHLSLAWAGGLNSPQINTIDFDGDGNEDLVIFDRAAGKILPYRNVDKKYQYAPDYDALFPATVNAWMLLRDFNCDGRKDLFTSDPFGIVVFVNTTKPGQPLSWREFNPGFPLLTEGFSGAINLKINDVDVPAIDDVDNDGDLDILAMRFVGIGTVEWHKNMSVERTGRCDSMQLHRVTQIYGGVTDCVCGVFAFGGQPCDLGGRTQHVGGKALLSVDVDGDADNDLLYAEETCASLYVFRNDGTKDSAIFNFGTNFPFKNPATFPLFPAPFLEDVDFDGLKDLVVAPNLYARSVDNILVRNSVWLYKNTGSADKPTFTFAKNSFLQENMIDVGDYSTPALADVDNDGDDDLFIGVYADENFRARIYYFQNVGTASEPSFKLITNDFAGLSFYLLFDIKLQFADLNADGNIDLAFVATSLSDGKTYLLYIPNKSRTGYEPDFSQIGQTKVALNSGDNAYVTDVNRDGIPDLLIGKTTGALQYWQNSANNGLFDQLTLKSGSYLGLGTSTSRQSPAVAESDLDGDGTADLVVGDQRGNLIFYGDYRNFDPALSQPQSDILYNSVIKDYVPGNFGGRMSPTVSNLFNASKPAIIVGNTLGGLYVLRNDGGNDLPDQPVVMIGPNPLDRGDDLKIRSDRNTRVQIFSVLGQKMSEQVFIPANQTYPLALKELAAGMYIARFSFAGQHISLKFILK
jgi:hypothetical protein